ncbi:16S rRNA (cytosine(967)-C(5))-methyltransferase RsmB [Ectothiorhodospira lacustris]|uniref:16S rRNA (cytosine(967)-C(5))-methyltransferase RsmB n=1 Tax=Ectothiorhodospira lacustris TaxID=2899127 RepID=UPI001EE97C79|nr:16S rRNA (cytosine(967)-C(5))-methyltransferase RsmB [Ectothiorhodospira lacustris]MCG5501733.1 16S rRNA (cytosine(967)-C(5))-methyltransferase RsmB [Ectothiorhodospira lacustris]MCG5509156.1 16S rRNA (cytosine(967)-C(5))-methyltransferase RsmB [Ectothiorhodospira lacustris]MCG5520946.1 16S rRNA (cytosine(967)-C(5))-methyltransferase RsmB [Ectothiorhodospira lacustris]
MSLSAREAALSVILRVLQEGGSLSEALPTRLDQVSARDRGLVQALSYGTLRWHRRLEAMLAQWMDKPLRGRDQDVACALAMGLFELLYMNTPDYAAIQQTADLGRRLRKKWAVGLINGVLRRAQREADEIARSVDHDPAVRHALPDWLYRRLASTYGEDAETLCQALNAHPPMTLRVNLARIGRDDYRRSLADQGLAAQPHPWVETALTLEQPVAVDRLPGFDQGLVSVQDAAAQLSAPLLECTPGMRVLDACAAPGGKTLHLLEQAGGDLDLTAVDADPARLERVRENLRRGGFDAHLIAADAGAPEQWHQGPGYDRILLDAPCSATGVIRRHPDIKHLRREEDIQALQTQQARLLRALWPLLAPGGMLLYVTCSLMPEENVMTVAPFLAEESGARERPIEASWGLNAEVGRQLRAGEQGMDGFFYARLSRI